MATSGKPKKIYFLPYLPLDREIQLGDVIFWPFYQLKERYIPDENIRGDLERIFSCYENNDGQALDSITIASVVGRELSPLPPDDEQRLDFATKTLAFASIVKNVYGFQYRNSENFQVYTQEFVVGQEELTLVSQFRRQAYGGYILSLGPYKLEKLRFTQPQNVLLSGTKDVDARLLDASVKVIQSRNGNQNAERIIRSLEWFYFAHFDLRDIPDTSVAVMLATAFESLFSLPQFGTRHFIGRVEDSIVSRSTTFLDPLASARITKTDWRNKRQNYNNAGWWAHDFYGLRSDIVHGRSWNLLHKGRSHIEIADIVFIECVKRKLEENGFYTYSSEDEEFRKAIYKNIDL